MSPIERRCVERLGLLKPKTAGKQCALMALHDRYKAWPDFKHQGTSVGNRTGIRRCLMGIHVWDLLMTLRLKQRLVRARREPCLHTFCL